jgi:hypothetical protein
MWSYCWGTEGKYLVWFGSHRTDVFPYNSMKLSQSIILRPFHCSSAHGLWSRTVGKCQYQLDASAETRPDLLERRNVTSLDSRWETGSRVDQAEQRAEQGERRPDLRMLVTLRCYVAAECSSLDAALDPAATEIGQGGIQQRKIH